MRSNEKFSYNFFPFCSKKSSKNSNYLFLKILGNNNFSLIGKKNQLYLQKKLLWPHNDFTSVFRHVCLLRVLSGSFKKVSHATSLCFVLFSQPKLPTDFQSRFQAASDGAALMCNKVKNFPSDHSQSAGETNEIFHR